MGDRTHSRFVFDRPLYLDRKRGKYTFEASSDAVEVVKEGREIDLESLELLFNPFAPVRLAHFREMFDEEVARYLDALESGGAATADRPAEATDAAAPERTAPAAKAPAPPAEQQASAPAAEPESYETPSLEAMRAQREELRSQVSAWVSETESTRELLRGACDEAIRDLIVGFCKKLRPRRVLATGSFGDEPTSGDHATDTAITSQAFGVSMSLGEKRLLEVARSALAQGAARGPFSNIVLLKQKILLGESSPRFRSMVQHYYKHLVRFLESFEIAPETARMIDRSKYIYLGEANKDIGESALVLGTADAFMSLKEAKQRNVDVLGILPQHLRRVLPSELVPAAETAEALLGECCYVEIPPAAGSEDGPDDQHSSFFPVGRSLQGILAFRIGGSDDDVAWMRNLLVYVLERMPDRTNPAHVVGVLNRFALKYPFAREIFIELFYGVVNGREETLTYTTAGYPAPVLVRGDDVTVLKSTGGQPLNMAGKEYSNLRVPLELMDCIVLPNDAVAELLQQQLASSFAPRAGNGHSTSASTPDARALILAAARDEQVRVDEGLKMQVYRHL